MAVEKNTSGDWINDALWLGARPEDIKWAVNLGKEGWGERMVRLIESWINGDFRKKISLGDRGEAAKSGASCD